MSQTLVARRYASALFKTALERKALPEVTADVRAIAGLCRDSAEFLYAVENPVLPAAVRKKAVHSALSGRVTALTLDFTAFLTAKKRTGLLPEIAERFIAMEEEHRGVAEASLVSARPTDPASLAELTAGLARKYSKTYTISASEDPDLLGGFQLTLGDRVYDYSLKNQIKLLKEKLLDTRG